jgi:multicomponent Na+:H+ antiporter subunit C
MTPNVTLLVLIGSLYAAGVFLLLERSLTRVLLGVLLVGNATNVLLISAGGPAGGAPIVGRTATEDMSDPLAQALILTAIVITLGTTAFLLSMIYRAWHLAREGDEVVDDVEDRAVARRAAPGAPEDEAESEHTADPDAAELADSEDFDGEDVVPAGDRP